MKETISIGQGTCPIGNNNKMIISEIITAQGNIAKSASFNFVSEKFASKKALSGLEKQNTENVVNNAKEDIFTM